MLLAWLAWSDKRGARTYVDQAEQRALWNLECLLEKAVDESVAPNYDELLKAARDRLRDREE